MRNLFTGPKKGFLFSREVMVTMIILFSVFPPSLAFGQSTSRTQIKVPASNELNEDSVSRLIDNLVRQGLLNTSEGEKAKLQMELITPEQWSQVRELSKFSNLENSRSVASVTESSADQEKASQVLDLKESVDDFDQERYHKLSREVESVLANPN